MPFFVRFPGGGGGDIKRQMSERVRGTACGVGSLQTLSDSPILSVKWACEAQAWGFCIPLKPLNEAPSSEVTLTRGQRWRGGDRPVQRHYYEVRSPGPTSWQQGYLESHSPCPCWLSLAAKAQADWEPGNTSGDLRQHANASSHSGAWRSHPGVLPENAWQTADHTDSEPGPEAEESPKV